ncbi:Receptor-like protein kinase [Quillaja saponaria]|uniref:Receptor-like protein kinase n=1 Tax=Quillaja saponaria TaxID=32244 RepID=A0AAD7LIY8_QUISA|nr:Receptor-like protein kinase [Quillaja saponaria]
MSKLPSFFAKILFILFLFFVLTIPSRVISQPANSEQTILLNVKLQLGNPPLIQSWNSSYPPCDWPEIKCTGGSVTGIDLRDKNITEKIPATICELKNLTKLDVAYNSIPGKFPRILFNCSNLQILDLSQNYFDGTIPDDIDRLPTLRYLDLGANSFYGDIPAAVGKLTELTTLYLHQNLFNGTFPKEIGDLSNLEFLGLAFNGFVGMAIPPEFGKLKKLRYMWIAGSNLMGEIPESLSNLTSFEYLDLSKNNLVGKIPSNLFMLRNLSFVLLYNNDLSSEIPSSVQALNLTEIDLSMNNLTGTIPDDFGKLMNLEVLQLFSNQLSGEIPKSLGLIQTLKQFKVFTNKLNGTLPPELGLHSKLEVFEVSENQLSGELPEYLCAGGALQGVVAFSNKLAGEMPKWVENCTTLRSVQLYNNNFSGPVPSGLWTSRNLSSIMLSGNSFSGLLPNKLARNLSRVEISDNKFSGRIPSGISSSLNLVVFKATNNLLSGEIPSELTNLSNLNTLMLDGNQLSGPLPSQIDSWKSLTFLTLSRNKLSGKIPVAMVYLPDLVYLDLSDNELSGEIPPQLGHLKLTFLNLSSNKLSGKIPDEFDNLAYENSFLNNSYVCANDPILNLPSCHTKLPHQKKSSSKNLALILILVTTVFIASVLFTLYKVRNYMRKHSLDKLSTWKITSFQRLDFTEFNVLSNLTENNLIGKGGSGEVYRIASSRPGEFIAVKRIWNRVELDHKLDKQFLAEVQILGTIRHSNIVKLLCCISCENSKILVYEYMENQSLDKWLYRKKRKSVPGLGSDNNLLALNWPMRLRIAIDTAQGLSYMHHECSLPIIHQDVKSSNILLDSEFRAKIADFGLAKMLAKKGEPHSMSAIAGSFGYIAPEYAYSTKVSEKVDVYSFGVVLLELVTGRDPISGNEQTTLVDWARRYYNEGKPIDDAIDEEIKGRYLEEMTSVFKLGLICTGTLPSTRPSMKEILQILRQCCLPEGSEGKKMGTEFDATPLLSNVTYLSSYKRSQKVTQEIDESCVYSV